MDVDYIRVHQVPDTAERFDTSFADDFSGWRQITAPFTSFTRSRQQPTGAPTGQLAPNSIWGYAFEVPRGFRKSVLLAQVQLASRAGTCARKQ